MSGSTADPEQDPRNAPDPRPMWTIFDSTPEGRDPRWYPKLDYFPSLNQPWSLYPDSPDVCFKFGYFAEAIGALSLVEGLCVQNFCT